MPPEIILCGTIRGFYCGQWVERKRRKHVFVKRVIWGAHDRRDIALEGDRLFAAFRTKITIEFRIFDVVENVAEFFADFEQQIMDL